MLAFTLFKHIDKLTYQFQLYVIDKVNAILCDIVVDVAAFSTILPINGQKQFKSNGCIWVRQFCNQFPLIPKYHIILVSINVKLYDLFVHYL